MSLPFSWVSPPQVPITPRLSSRNAASLGIYQPQYDYIDPSLSTPYDPANTFASTVCCPLCQEVYATPIELKCCGMVICSSCVRRWKNASQQKGDARCCYCFKEWTRDTLVPHAELKKLVDDLHVCCLHKRQGCSWVGPRKYLLVHVAEECIFSPLSSSTSQSMTLFYLSLLDSTNPQQTIVSTYPRISSILSTIIPPRYRTSQNKVPPRTSSHSPPQSPTHRQAPFKRAGKRGSVIVPTRSQSMIVPQHHKGAYVPPPDDETLWDSIVRDVEGLRLEDDEHVGLGLYMREQQSGGGSQSWVTMSDVEEEPEDEVCRVKRELALRRGVMER